MANVALRLRALSGKAQIAAALSEVEKSIAHPAVTALLEEAYAEPKGMAIGITGPPGAGKSTLIDALIAAWRRQGHAVAVLAVDPSSKASGGALLGDRIRMRTDPADSGVLVRSFAARGRLGGLADSAYPAATLLLALYDHVLVESVGVGQSETDIAVVADTVILCVQPASGDSLQFMKAGIAEIPDIAVVTKADIGAAATRALADLKGALSLGHRDASAFPTECLSVSVIKDKGAPGRILDAISRHEAWLRQEDRLAAIRKKRAQAWLELEILAQFGRRGLALARQEFFHSSDDRPFASLQRALNELFVTRRSE